jgi:hypothetical protein
MTGKKRATACHRDRPDEAVAHALKGLDGRFNFAKSAFFHIADQALLIKFFSLLFSDCLMITLVPAKYDGRDTPTAEVSADTRSHPFSWLSIVLPCALIVHAALVLGEVLEGPIWVAVIECLIASAAGLQRLREHAAQTEDPALIPATTAVQAVGIQAVPPGAPMTETPARSQALGS